MQNILVDMHRLKYHPYNGLYTFSYNLGKALANLSIPNMNFNFYLPKNKINIFGNNVNYINHNSLDKYYMFGTNKFDVWHTTTTLSWYKPFNKKTKVIFTIHDLNFLFEDKNNIKRNKRLLGEIQKRIDRADYLIGISKYALNIATEYLHINNKPQKVIYNGCNLPLLTHFIDPKYKPTRPFLFYIGLIEPRKNIHLLPALLKNNEYELIIAGKQDENYMQLINKEILKFDVKDRVRFIGTINENDKYWYLKTCEAFLFPSYAEGFGLPIIEAMQFGKPVFLSNKTCMPEIGGEAAYYFKNFETENMQQCFVDGMQHYKNNQPINLIKERALSFSWEKAANECIDIYKNL